MIECRINGELYELQFPFSISEQVGNNVSSDISVKISDSVVEQYISVKGYSEQGDPAPETPSYPTCVEVYGQKLYSLPNGVRDEITAEGKLIKRVASATCTSVDLFGSPTGDYQGASARFLTGRKPAHYSETFIYCSHLSAQITLGEVNAGTSLGFAFGVHPPQREFIWFTLPFSLLGATKNDTAAARRAAMNAWLTAQAEAGTPFTVYYELMMPVETDLPKLTHNQRIPKSGDLIELQEEGRTLFLGTCGIPTSPKYESERTPLIYRIKCGNGNSLLRRRIVNYGTQNKTITEIVEYLFDHYILAEGISKGIISNVPIALNAYTAADMNLQDVLNELADYVSGAWQVTNDRVFHFIAKEDFDAFPEEVTAETFLGAEIQVQTKDQDMRTNQTVKGLMAVTDTQTELFVFDGVVDVFDTLFPIVQKPTQIKRSDEVVLDPSRIGVKGIDDNNPNMVFLFSYNSRELEYCTVSDWLSSGQSFSVSYVGQFPIRVHSYNIPKITEISVQTGTSGLIDHVHEDNTLTTVEDAQRLADALISNYGKERTELTFWLRSTHIQEAGYSIDDFRLMRKFTFNMPEIGLVGEYVISERTLESLAPGECFEDSLKIILKMVDRSFVKSYGQTLKVLVKQQMRNIREDVIVVSQQELSDSSRFAEAQIWSYGHPVFWPVISTATTNDPFDGLDIYPC